MATITASTPTAFLTATKLVPHGATSSPSVPILGLPIISRRGGVKCSAEKSPAGGALSKGAAVLTAASAMVASSPALALVDERLSTEGTGLSLGLSNNLLGWILLGVFGLIWALFFVYTSTLDEDEESDGSLSPLHFAQVHFSFQVPTSVYRFNCTWFRSPAAICSTTLWVAKVLGTCYGKWGTSNSNTNSSSLPRKHHAQKDNENFNQDVNLSTGRKTI